jgi:DNA-binding phage protein
MSRVAPEAQLNQENLYRMLSNKGDPKLTSLGCVLHVLGSVQF